MASDSKRIPAPESIPYHLSGRQKAKSYKEKLAITLENGKRQDNRQFDEARKICKYTNKTLKSFWYNNIIIFVFSVLKLNVISKAKGSAYIEMGNTKVIGSVFDPREIPNKQNNFR